MGKKAKHGKQRRDKFYKLAKETGYRSRAAFKLLQLNRKFQFLECSNCLIDLCAAPGSWLQAAQQHMPISSSVVGVDLVPIAPIPGVKTFQCDITTEKCRSMLTKELGKGVKADVVLNDGAPNMGVAWEQDAYDQVSLCLKALGLACHFLRADGWFITKVFRSKDYSALLWVCQQLFHHVTATKPEASRLESAEIFIVCRGYLAPDSLDPKLLDPKYIFKETEVSQSKRLEKAPDVIKVSQLISGKKKRAEGYSDTSHPLVYHPVPLSEFVLSRNHLELLKEASSLEIDMDIFKKHPATTNEIITLFKDIQVLGRRELRILLKWRDTLRNFIDQSDSVETDPLSGSGTDVSEGESELKLINTELSREKRQKKKRERKVALKRKLKLAESMKMFPGGVQDMSHNDMPLFNINGITNEDQLQEMLDGDIEPPPEDTIETFKPPLSRCDWDMRDEEDLPDTFKSGTEPLEDTFSIDSSNDEAPILTESLGRNVSHSRGDKWFERDVFNQSEHRADRDEDIDLKNAVAQLKGVKNVSQQLTNGSVLPQQHNMDIDGYHSQSDSDESVTGTITGTKRLDPIGLALAEQMFLSKGSREDIIDGAYNRYTNRDEGLDIPDWFLDDEEKHSFRILPVTKQQVEYYNTRQKEIDNRPIKKIVEAKAKRKFKAAKKVEMARKILDNLPDTNDVTAQKEKIDKIKKLYKKAGQIKSRGKVSYVVSKKSDKGQGGRPKGVKGRYKRVDSRMKKDRRNAIKSQKKNSKNFRKYKNK
ncbi:Pre-rRNA processing protein FTSJ3 [Oopsacas minuta]|uniref:Putative rRNA methyltransferase n=1 Tax=Oopsacas minuta TaxID=111878 RepID=A0AAV7K4W9_9METZ|nr:Pre-rRNA processing protein FTSJ3 [Oopsacas minuta]